jgi:hypothetical protein
MLAPSLEDFSRLLGHLYDGHIEEDPYNSFLNEARAIIDSNFGSITMREPQGDDGGLLFVSSDVLQKTFVDDHDNPYTDKHYTSNLMTNLPWGQVVCLDECISYSQLENTELYRFCMAPIDIYHMLGVDLRNAMASGSACAFVDRRRLKTLEKGNGSSSGFWQTISSALSPTGCS